MIKKYVAFSKDKPGTFGAFGVQKDALRRAVASGSVTQEEREEAQALFVLDFDEVIHRIFEVGEDISTIRIVRGVFGSGRLMEILKYSDYVFCDEKDAKEFSFMPPYAEVRVIHCGDNIVRE